VATYSPICHPSVQGTQMHLEDGRRPSLCYSGCYQRESWHSGIPEFPARRWLIGSQIALRVPPFQPRLSSRPSLSLRGSRTRHGSVASPTPTPNASSLPRIVSTRWRDPDLSYYVYQALAPFVDGRGINNSVCFNTNERTCASASGRTPASQRAANCELAAFVTDHRALKCSSTSQAPVHL
jgi:hypothetical protein